MVYSKKHGFVGTADGFGTMDNNIPIVLDLKTSSDIYDEMGLQLGAYNGAFKEEFNVGMERGLIVLCGKDGSFKTRVWSRPELEDAYAAFLGLYTTYKYFKKS